MLHLAVVPIGTLEGGREGAAGEPCALGAGAGICGEGKRRQAAAAAAASAAAATSWQRQQGSGAEDREWMLGHICPPHVSAAYGATAC